MKIPKGWRRLRVGTQLKTGDKYVLCGKWLETKTVIGITNVPFSRIPVFIRKIK